MMTVEDCRRRAAEHLQAAQEASDPNTSQSLRRLSDQWTRLAQQIEQDASRPRHSPPPVKRPADLTELRKTSNTDSAQVADILRERLQLSDFDEPKS
jgi:hypothetical protein